MLIQNFQGDQITVGGYGVVARADLSWGVSTSTIDNLTVQNVTFKDTDYGVRGQGLISGLIQQNTNERIAGVVDYFVYVVNSTDLVVRANYSDVGCYWVTDATNAMIGGPASEDGNVVNSCPYNGIWLGQQFAEGTSSNGVIQNNIVNGAEEGGIVVWNWPGESAEIQILDNTVSNVRAVSDPHGGISVYNGVFDNLVIKRNISMDSIEVSGKPAPPGLKLISNTIVNADISDNLFMNNSGDGIALYNVTRTGDIRFALNQIVGNLGDAFSMVAGTSDVLGAFPNWWGSADGPEAGSIVGNVEVKPWCGN